MNQNRCSQPSVPSPKATVLIFGSLPPPYIGPAVATKVILDSELKEEFRLIHLDISDHRSVTNIAKLDLRNIYLTLFHIFKLLVFLIKYSPGVVYIPICQTIIGYLRDVIFILLSKIFGARVIIHLRGGYFRTLYEKSNPFVKFVIRNSCKFVSKAIVLGETLRYIFDGLILPDRISVVSNGIDRNYITDTELENVLSNKHYALSTSNNSASSANRNLRGSAFKVLFLSNLKLSKGFFDVIKSIPIIIQKNIPSPLMGEGMGDGGTVQFIFAGEFCEDEKVKKEIFDYINSHNLSPFIEFIGVVDKEKKKRLLLFVDIFVFPTYYFAEGQPWVIIEAMSAGLPIITTDAGCIKEMVIDGENGFIIEKQNPTQIAQKIIQLLDDTEMRNNMGKKSRERFLKYYTKEKFIGNLKRVFREVLSE